MIPNPPATDRARPPRQPRDRGPSTVRIMLALVLGIGLVAASLWVPARGALFLVLPAAGFAAGLCLRQHALLVGCAVGAMVAIPLVAFELMTRNAALRHPLVPIVEWGELLQLIALVVAPTAGAALVPGALKLAGAQKWAAWVGLAGVLVGIDFVRTRDVTVRLDTPAGRMTSLEPGWVDVEFSVVWDGPGWVQLMVFSQGQPLSMSEFVTIEAAGEQTYGMPCVGDEGPPAHALHLVVVSAGGAEMPVVQEANIAQRLGGGATDPGGGLPAAVTDEVLRAALPPGFGFLHREFRLLR